MNLPTTIGVTGAAGFIGSNLVSRLLDEGCTVIGVDDLSMGTLDNLAGCMEHPRFTYHEFDCCDESRLMEVFGACDSIAHMAAMKIPRYHGALDTLRVNVDGAHAAFHVALETGAHVILASTSDVYGKAQPPFREDDPIVLGPPTVRRWSYAASKYFDEHLAMRLVEEKGMRCTTLRFFNAYGPRNHLTWWGGPASIFLENVLDGVPMELHGDGTQTRSFTYVSDTVDGVVRTLERPETSGELINIGNDQPIAIIELAEKVQHMIEGVGGPVRANFVPFESLPGKYEDVVHRMPDISKAERLLGFRPTVSLDDGLRETIAWHRMLRETRGLPVAERAQVRVA